MSDLSTEQKRQIAQDLMKDLMVWQGQMKDLSKKLDVIEDKVYNQFAGHLVKGYIDKFDSRSAYLWNILDNILNRE